MAKLRIDTTRGISDATASSSVAEAVLHGNRPASEFDWYISVRDAQLLGSLEPVYPLEDSSRKIYVEISSPTIADGASENERIIKNHDPQQEPVIQQTVPTLIYTDVRVDHPQQANDEGDCDVPRLPKESCYMHIQDQGGSKQSGTITVPDFVLECATILHVRDSLSITILPAGASHQKQWIALEWCRIERCPELDCVFATGHQHCKYHIRILLASQLPKARYIWKWSEDSWIWTYGAFSELKSLHLDHCPRLIYVNPFPLSLSRDPRECGFLCLETLEIMWCGDLKKVITPTSFRANEIQEQPWANEIQEQPGGLVFPKLKWIHLHELPKLYGICGLWFTIFAPQLEIVKIRGCWSLKHLPIVKKEVRCECEKEWWDSLEWEDALQKKLYKPTHSKYYKKTRLLRGSMLR